MTISGSDAANDGLTVTQDTRSPSQQSKNRSSGRCKRIDANLNNANTSRRIT